MHLLGRTYGIDDSFFYSNKQNNPKNQTAEINLKAQVLNRCQVRLEEKQRVLEELQELTSPSKRKKMESESQMESESP